MILLYDMQSQATPRNITMSVINLESGKAYINYELTGIRNNIEFLELYNERVLFKVKGSSLKIIDVSVKGFEFAFSFSHMIVKL